MTNAEKANWLNHKIDNAYNMAQGAMNRICITKDNDEYGKMLKSINHHTAILTNCAKCRANNYDGFDEIYAKYTPKPANIVL